jgi:20S proteasome subunit beta 6
MYQHNHGEEIGTRSLSQLLGNTLYHRRFFPYYAFNVLAGLDENGVGAVYGYDAVGSFQRQPDGIMANGSGSKLIMPVLDNLVAGQHRKECQDGKREYNAEEAVALIKEGFITAGERDIMCGDAVEIILITKDGQKKEVFPLKKD